MQAGLRQSDRTLSRQIGSRAQPIRSAAGNELRLLIRDVCMRNSPNDWQRETEAAIKDVGATIKSGEFTVDEWIKALS